MSIYSSFKQIWVFGKIGNLDFLFYYFFEMFDFNNKYPIKFFKGCDFYGFCGGLFGFVSITTMLLMTIERYVIIRNPLISIDFKIKPIISRYY